MTRRMAAAALLAILAGGPVRGQSIPAPPRPPVVSPWLNPVYATPGMRGQAALLYLLRQNDARGGPGSGRMHAALAARSPGQQTARLSPGSMAPGASLTRYFQRGPANRPLEGSAFRRHDRYFSKNPYAPQTSP